MSAGAQVASKINFSHFFRYHGFLEVVFITIF